MSTHMNITATERGVVRLFAIETAQTFTHSDLAKALNVDTLDEKHADIITIDDLDELGLEDYLALGMGIAADEIEAMRPQISVLKNDVGLVRSSAFMGQATTLTPTAPLRWIATFGEVPIDTSVTPIKTASATGILTGPPPKTGPSNNKVLLWVLAAFAFIVAVTISMLIRITP